MEDIRNAALAYYVHLSNEQKKTAADCFKTMDKSGKGKVSLREYAEFFKQTGFGFAEVAHSDFFKALDLDGNGSLDFNEFITLYYLWISERMMFCQECRVFLPGLYFSCVQCLNGSGPTYDLCCACYRNKNIDHHQDAIFLDNYALLRYKRKKVQASATATSATASQRSATATSATASQRSVNRREITTRDVIQATALGVSTVSFATGTAPKLWDMGKDAFQDIGSSASEATSYVASGFDVSDIAVNIADAASACIIM